MTLTARILVGHGRRGRIPFPGPGIAVDPRMLDLAATQLVNNDTSVNAVWVYRAIGFDHETAEKYWIAFEEEKQRKAALEEEEKRKAALAKDGEDAGGEADRGEEEKKDAPAPGLLKKQQRFYPKAVGLELIVSLLLSCLGDPERALCPCRVHRTGRLRGVPYGHAPEGNPDVRADYEGFTVLAEVTMQETLGGKLRRKTVKEQWDSAVRHVGKALKERGQKRVYCLMVSKADLTDGRMRVRLLKAPTELDEKHRDRAKFLVFGIRELTHIGYRLHKLYCRGRTGVRPLTGADLAMILDQLHARTMAVFNKSGSFKAGWAGLTFARLLEDHAGVEAEDGESADLLELEPEDGQEAP